MQDTSQTELPIDPAFAAFVRQVAGKAAAVVQARERILAAPRTWRLENYDEVVKFNWLYAAYRLSLSNPDRYTQSETSRLIDQLSRQAQIVLALELPKLPLRQRIKAWLKQIVRFYKRGS